MSELLAIWDEGRLLQVLEETPDAGVLLTSLQVADVEALLKGPTFEPVAEASQSRLDQKKRVTCPECGHEFTP